MHGARRRTAPVREGEEDEVHAGTIGECGRAHVRGGRRRAQCTVHCVVGRTVPVTAAASSGIGECQGGVKGVETGMVARLGMLGQAGQRARAQQSARRHSGRVFCMPARPDERGHRVNYDIRPR